NTPSRNHSSESRVTLPDVVVRLKPLYNRGAIGRVKLCPPAFNKNLSAKIKSHCAGHPRKLLFASLASDLYLNAHTVQICPDSASQRLFCDAILSHIFNGLRAGTECALRELVRVSPLKFTTSRTRMNPSFPFYLAAGWIFCAFIGTLLLPAAALSQNSPPSITAEPRAAHGYRSHVGREKAPAYGGHCGGDLRDYSGGNSPHRRAHACR